MTSFLKRIDTVLKYFVSEEYKETWKSGCHAAIRKIRTADTKVARNVLKYLPDLALPTFPTQSSASVYIYFLDLLCSSVPTSFVSFYFLLLIVVILILIVQFTDFTNSFWCIESLQNLADLS